MESDSAEEGLGLLPLDPLPLTEIPSNTSSRASAPSKHHHHHLNTSHLGLSHHSPAWYLLRIQKYSTYVFSAFAVAHIANTSLIPLATRSVHASESYLLLTRPYYQGLPAEPLLITIPVFAHVLSGIALRVYRRGQNAKRFGDADSSRGKDVRVFLFSGKFWPAVSGISVLGFPFVPLLFGHAYINRVIPLEFPGGASNVNLGYVSHAFARHPALSAVGFAGLVGVGVFHMTWGWAKWLGLTPTQSTELGVRRGLVKKRRWYVINAVAAAVTGLWMAGLLGVVAKGGEAPGWTGRLYDEMYKRVPVVGGWL